jgi:hypothetical protein
LAAAIEPTKRPNITSGNASGTYANARAQPA